MSSLRILIAEDDLTYREELREILSRKEDIEVVAAVEDGGEVLNIAATRRIDVALLDVDMPVVDGITAAQRLRNISPSTKVVMLTAFEQESFLGSAIAAGVSGFLTKDLSTESIYRSINDANNGVAVMGPRPTQMLMSAYHDRTPRKSEDHQFIEAVHNLPPRLHKTYMLLTEAMPNKDIARRLGLRDATIRTYVSRILLATGCSSRSELAVRAITSQACPPVRNLGTRPRIRLPIFLGGRTLSAEAPRKNAKIQS